MSTKIANIIGQRIKQHRKSQNLSQEDLAYKASLHPTYIGQLERGEKNATLESIEKVSYALGVSLEKLFRGIQPELCGQAKCQSEETSLILQNASHKEVMTTTSSGGLILALKGLNYLHT